MFCSNRLHTLDRPSDCNQWPRNGPLADTARTESAAWCREASKSPTKPAAAGCTPASAGRFPRHIRALWCSRWDRDPAGTSSGASDWCHDTSSCCHDT